MTSIAAARTFQDLLGPDVEAAPYEFGTLFEAKTWSDRRRAKTRFKLLKKLDPRLRRILEPGERVFFVTSGTTANAAEQFFVGWVAAYLNRRALVFTTQRLLLVQIDSRGNPQELLSQLRFEQIASVKSTWSRICEIRLQRGSKLKFQSVPSAERKFLHKFLQGIVSPAAAADADPVNHVEHLCPKCYAMVPGHPESCPKCTVPFKSATKAGWLSFAFPGLGDFYLGHKGFATFELLGGIFFWTVLVVIPVVDGGVVDADTGAIQPIDTSFWVGTGIFLMIAHTIDGIMTHHFGQKGHYHAKA